MQATPSRPVLPACFCGVHCSPLSFEAFWVTMRPACTLRRRSSVAQAAPRPLARRLLVEKGLEPGQEILPTQIFSPAAEAERES